MAKFLFGWELGGNFGHMTTFNGIARELSQRGHTVYAALQNLQEAGPFFDGANIHYLQSPMASKQYPQHQPKSLSYSHVIERSGFMHPTELTTLLRGWRELYSLVQPDVTILNAPPVSLLAARQRNFKLATIGPGYHSPPRTTPFPPFFPDQPDPTGILLHEEKLLRVINEAMNRLGMPKVEALRELFDIDREFLTTFQELDHFPSREGATYYGAQFSLTDGTPLPWPEPGTGPGEDKRIFVYIRPKSQHFKPLLAALKQVPMRVIVAAPGLSSADAQQLSAPHLRVHPGSVRLAEIRAQCDLAISAGGHGTIAAFLLGGVPMILLPNHTEQLMVARAALQTGAVVIPKKGQPPTFLPMIRDIISQPRFRHRAGAFADKYKTFQAESQSTVIANELEQMAKA
jgi:UDP:flavonoid glycosyltransferase YjiC (YdhE family)